MDKKVSYRQAKQRMQEDLGIEAYELRESVFPISEDRFRQLENYYRTKIKHWKNDLRNDELPF